LIFKKLYDLEFIFQSEKAGARFNREQRAALKKFSFAAAALALFPLLLAILLGLVAGTKFGYISLGASLVVLLVFMCILYFIIPMLAGNILSIIVSMKPKNSKGKENKDA